MPATPKKAMPATPKIHVWKPADKRKRPLVIIEQMDSEVDHLNHIELTAAQVVKLIAKLERARYDLYD